MIYLRFSIKWAKRTSDQKNFRRARQIFPISLNIKALSVCIEFVSEMYFSLFCGLICKFLWSLACESIVVLLGSSARCRWWIVFCFLGNSSMNFLMFSILVWLVYDHSGGMYHHRTMTEPGGLSQLSSPVSFGIVVVEKPVWIKVTQCPKGLHVMTLFVDNKRSFPELRFFSAQYHLHWYFRYITSSAGGLVHLCWVTTMWPNVNMTTHMGYIFKPKLWAF